MTGLIITLFILSLLMGHWRRRQAEHEARIRQLRVRVHINGIRGKSTVTRLTAGVLREGGIQTVAKTTGSAARIIHEDGNESPLSRRGAPTILEQIDIISNHVNADTEALVIECMAVNPLYQKVSQEQIVKGNIGVITNVREDHQDVMGETLEEIADSLANTIPRNGLLIVGEERDYLRERLTRIAEARNSTVLYADPAWITDDDLKRFHYLSFKENLAIGLALAQLLDIPREVAMRGMEKALPDIGSVFIQKARERDKEIIWAPLFAVNDRESAVIGVNALKPYHKPTATRIGLLNNRYDRAVRATQFAEIAARDIQLDYYITFGAYEEQVTERMVDCGYPRSQIINLGFSKDPTLDQIFDQIAALINGDQGVLIGMVNIHTPQAELLMEHFHHLENDDNEETGKLTFDLDHIPRLAQRQRYMISHLPQASRNG